MGYEIDISAKFLDFQFECTVAKNSVVLFNSGITCVSSNTQAHNVLVNNGWQAWWWLFHTAGVCGRLYDPDFARCCVNLQV